MNCAPPPPIIADALKRYAAPVQARLHEIRALIFAVAAQTGGVGELTETLKWGEPAYLTEKSKSGTTIRLGTSKLAPKDAALFVNCQTSLIDDFRSQFDDVFTFEGNRAVIVSATGPLPRDPLALCIGAALTYHKRPR